MGYKAVLFDLGETLLTYGAVDVDKVFLSAAHLTYQYLQGRSEGGNWGDFDDYYQRHVRGIKWHYFWAVVTGREFDCLGLLKRQGKRMGLTLGREELEELGWLWYEPLAAMATFEDDLHEQLRALQGMGLKLGIVSNTFIPPRALDRHLERCGLLDFFPVRQYSSATVYRKPDRRIFTGALERLGVAAEEAVMVGDRMRQDVRGARRLGMAAVYKRGALNEGKKVPADVPVITRIGELPELIRDWENG